MRKSSDGAENVFPSSATASPKTRGASKAMHAKNNPTRVVCLIGESSDSATEQLRCRDGFLMKTIKVARRNAYGRDSGAPRPQQLRASRLVAQRAWEAAA